MSCREFTRKDLCTPNPCGSGATCQPGSDRSGSDRPVCTCPSGFRGDPLVACTRGKFTICKFSWHVFCFQNCAVYYKKKIVYVVTKINSKLNAENCQNV